MVLGSEPHLAQLPFTPDTVHLNQTLDTNTRNIRGFP